MGDTVAQVRHHKQPGKIATMTPSSNSQQNYYSITPPSSTSPSSSSTSPSSSTSSSTENLTPIIDQNNNEKSINATAHSLPRKRTKAAVKFKYQANAIEEDLREMRILMANWRNEQSLHVPRIEFEFLAADFERMMADDWLVTRFLLRGAKALKRERHLQTDTSSDGDSDSTVSDGDAAAYDTGQMKRAIYLKTMELIKTCAEFRLNYKISGKTHESEFPTEWIKTNGLFHYKPDLAGNPSVYLRVALYKPKLIESSEARHQFKRYMLYTLERCDQQLFNRPGKAICCIFDMTNVALENINLELTTWMIKSFKSCSPKLLCYVLVYNPPWFFTATFRLICNTLLSNSKRQSIKFANGVEILEYIAHENLPEYIRKSL